MGECDATRSHVVMTEYGQRCLRWLSAKRSPQSARLVLRHGPRSNTVHTKLHSELRFTPILDCSPYDFRAPKSSDATRKLKSRHPAREKASRARRRHRGRARRTKVSRSRLVLPSHRFRGLCVSPRARKVSELLRVTASYIELKSIYTVQICIGASS